ncbi:hypothetical protein QVD17_28712 [Tagetes erecta]|uniref:RNA-binding S4 domain-containing protein n=1 Tax=Tagetes erecta TaxID=13708 RepID=A0AAD8NSP0_TARER|nr:hypothetical protein QVD17_28712 [Tagetes erecta]
MLLTMEEKDPRKIFEGEALMRRMNRYGLLDESQNKLDYVLALNVENFLERRLQTLVFKTGMAKSIHHAKVLIKQRNIRVGRQVVNVPSFMVRVDSQKHIDFSLTSPFGAKEKRVEYQKASYESNGLITSTFGSYKKLDCLLVFGLHFDIKLWYINCMVEVF